MRYYVPNIDSILYYVVVYHVAEGQRRLRTIGLFLGYTVLAGFLFLVISRANSVDHKADCINKHKQIGIAR